MQILNVCPDWHLVQVPCNRLKQCCGDLQRWDITISQGLPVKGRGAGDWIKKSRSRSGIWWEVASTIRTLFWKAVINT